METKRPLLCLQYPAIGPYTEPDECTPYPLTLFPKYLPYSKENKFVGLRM
jgi:hypothetical protein